MSGSWNRNFYTLLTAALLCDDNISSSAQPTDYTPPLRVHLPTGSWQAVGFRNGGANNPTGITSILTPGKYDITLGTTYNPTISSYGVSICFGSGTTPASYEDYRIETPISTGLSLGSASGSRTKPTTYDSDNQTISSTRTFTFTNSSSSSINVNEMAIYAKWDYGALDCCCIYREVFDETIVLAPGESLLVDFNRDGAIYNYTPYPA